MQVKTSIFIRFRVLWTANRIGSKFSVSLVLPTKLLIMWDTCGRPRLKLESVSSSSNYSHMVISYVIGIIDVLA